jgi:hypothetical protein
VKLPTRKAAATTINLDMIILVQAFIRYPSTFP